MCLDFDVRDRRRCTFHWRNYYGLWTHILARSNSLNDVLINLFLTDMQLLQMLTDGLEWCDVFIRLSFRWHPFTAEHPLTLILTAPIHCRASIDSHSDGTHSLQSIHWLSFWRHPFTAEHPLLRHWCRHTFLQIWWRNKLIYILDGLRMSIFSTCIFLAELFLYKGFSGRLKVQTQNRWCSEMKGSGSLYPILMDCHLCPVSPCVTNIRVSV